MTQTKNKKQTNRELSSLGQAIKNLEGVTDHIERKPETPKTTKAKSSIGSFTFAGNTINYIMIESDGDRFINFRMNMEYQKDELRTDYSDRISVMEKLNDQNNKTIGIKYFIANEDEKNITISANSEYIINEDIKSYSFIRFSIAILSTGFKLLGIHKQDE